MFFNTDNKTRGHSWASVNTLLEVFWFSISHCQRFRSKIWLYLPVVKVLVSELVNLVVCVDDAQMLDGCLHLLPLPASISDSFYYHCSGQSQGSDMLNKN